MEVAWKPGPWDKPSCTVGDEGGIWVERTGWAGDWARKTLSGKRMPGLSGSPLQSHHHRWSWDSASAEESPPLPPPKNA